MTVVVDDCYPLEGAGRERKVFVRGVGLAIDGNAELVSYSVPGHAQESNAAIAVSH